MDNHKIKYFLYARKSEESEDRQVASLDSQLNVLRELAAKKGLYIVKEFTESRSAKKPGRILFNEMIAELEKGKVQGIICWKLDRLARNPVDGGQIIWLLQTGVIHHIQTHERSYLPTDNVLLMHIELGMANQFILDLKVNTRRGMQQKARRGFPPQAAPLGYMPAPGKLKGEKEIIIDPDRFYLVQKIFDLMLTEVYNPMNIYNTVIELGLRTRKGAKFSRSNMYKILNNTFYYGEFEWPHGSGNVYEGKYEPMITRDEFDKVQEILGRKGKPRPSKLFFPFTGMIRCSECGAMVTAENKIKRQKNGIVRHYTYYHCTKRKNPNCKQKSISEKNLEEQIKVVLEEIEIPQKLVEWVIQEFKSVSNAGIFEHEKILNGLKKNYDLVMKKINRLLDLKLTDEISQEDFHSKKQELERERRQIQSSIDSSSRNIDEWIDNVEQLMNFSAQALKNFNSGSPHDKKQILAVIGSNLQLKNKKLEIFFAEPFSTLIKLQKSIRGVQPENHRFEPPKLSTNKRVKEATVGSSVALYPREDSNLRPAV